MATENEMGTRADGWDGEETLVKTRHKRFLEKAVWKIVEISIGNIDGVRKELDGLEVLKSGAPSVVEVVSQA